MTTKTESVPFFWTIGKPIDFSTLETLDNMKVPDLRGVLGSALAGAPPWCSTIMMRSAKSVRRINRTHSRRPIN
jgi:hypothetical protein